MTGWDFLYRFYESGGIIWTIVFLLACLLIWLIAHPSTVREWNTQITIWAAAILPKKRKKAFEKRISLTLDNTRRKIDKAMPTFMARFLPYDLKVKWVDETETLEALTREKQIVIYVPSYKDELRQVVSVLHSYCKEGFATKAKTYMPENAKNASDVIITQKLVQNAGNTVYDYFTREYLPDILKQDKSLAPMLDKLKKVDQDGLFIPVLFNEIDKFANLIYPAEPSPEVYDRIIHLMNFIYTIANRNPHEPVPLTFCEEEIRLKIILAVADYTSLRKPIHEAEVAIKAKSVNTIYILATGSKISEAKAIAKAVYEQNNQDIYEPVETNYKRYTRRISGTDSICFELNLR